MNGDRICHYCKHQAVYECTVNRLDFCTYLHRWIYEMNRPGRLVGAAGLGVHMTLGDALGTQQKEYERLRKSFRTHRLTYQRALADTPLKADFAKVAESRKKVVRFLKALVREARHKRDSLQSAMDSWKDDADLLSYYTEVKKWHKTQRRRVDTLSTTLDEFKAETTDKKLKKPAPRPIGPVVVSPGSGGDAAAVDVVTVVVEPDIAPVDNEGKDARLYDPETMRVYFIVLRRNGELTFEEASQQIPDYFGEDTRVKDAEDTEHHIMLTFPLLTDEQVKSRALSLSTWNDFLQFYSRPRTHLGELEKFYGDVLIFTADEYGFQPIPKDVVITMMTERERLRARTETMDVM